LCDRSNDASLIFSRSEPYLTIALIPAIGQPHRYTIVAWHSFGSGDFVKRCDGSEIEGQALSVSDPEFSSVVSDIINDYADEFQDHMSNLIIEFFVPKSLLCFDFYDLEYKQPLCPTRLGIEFKLSLRWLERAQARPTWFRWRNKWQQFRNLLNGETAQPVFWSCDLTPNDPESAYSAALSNTHYICLGWVSGSLDNESSGQLFCRILSAGVPIALWPREHLDDIGPIQQKMRELLGEDLLQLHDRLRQEHRSSMAKDEDCRLTRLLNLMWDDPERSPFAQELPLRSPIAVRRRS
jgi:hypothetical protein